MVRLRVWIIAQGYMRVFAGTQQEEGYVLVRRLDEHKQRHAAAASAGAADRGDNRPPQQGLLPIDPIKAQATLSSIPTYACTRTRPKDAPRASRLHFRTRGHGERRANPAFKPPAGPPSLLLKRADPHERA